MGEIFRARDLLLGVDVALKRVTVQGDQISFQQTVSGSTDFRLSLAQEFRFLATLRHPHIISVLDYGFDEQMHPYYTMDLLESSQTIVRHAQGLSVEERVKLLIQMTQALAYLHRRGIIHRDLKPENVLVQQDGNVKVLDFGLAVQSGRADGEEGLMAGTLGYMAPEIMMSEAPSERSDLFALGIIAYEVLGGEHPFGMESASQLTMDILYADPDFTALHVEDPVQRIVRRLMEKEPSKRYLNASYVVGAWARSIELPGIAENELIRDSYIKAARFVGRDQEFARLTAALHDALGTNPRGSAWLIGGESGVGKSRLMDELRALAMVEGALVLTGQGVNNGLPFQMWRNVLRRLVLSTPLNDFGLGVLKEVVPKLEELLGREIPSVPSVTGRAGLRRLATIITDMFREQRRPIVLLLEDLHWEEEGLVILESLVANLEDISLLIVGTYRNEERPDLPEKLEKMQAIELDRLTDSEIRALSVSILGERVGTQRNVLSLLKRETEGNVFFLVEVVRVLAEEAGKLSNIGAKTLPEAVFSGSMRTVIERRLSRLPIDAQPMLRLAAVHGREIDLAILKRIDPVMNYENWLVTCANAAILEAQEDSWRFAHDRMRDGILDMLAPAQVPKLNEMVAEAIEYVYPGDDSYASLLMDLWAKAGDQDKEAHYAYISGRQAFAVSDYQEALELFARSASIMRIDTPASLFIDQADIHYQLGNFKPARASLRMAMNREMNDEDRVTALTVMGDMAHEKGDYFQAEQLLEEALTLARQIAPEMGLARVLSSMGEAVIRLGDFNRAKTYLYEASSIAREINDNNRLLVVMNLIGVVHLAQGDVEQAEVMLQEAYFSAVSANNGERSMDIVNTLGNVSLAKQDTATAEQRFLTAIETAYKLGLVHNLALYVNNLARVRIQRGEMATARHDLHEALERALELNLMPWALQVMVSHGELYNAQQDRQRALRLFGLVQFHLGFNPEIGRQIETSLKAWGLTIKDAANAARGYDFEAEVSDLLGRPWTAKDS